jgi:flagellar protein FlbB
MAKDKDKEKKAHAAAEKRRQFLVLQADAELNKRIRNFVLLNLAGIMVALALLDSVGVLNLRKYLLPVTSRIPGLGNVALVNVEDPYLLSREERKKEQYTLKVLEENLKKKEEELRIKEIELKTTESRLADERDAVMALRKDFEDKKREYQDYKKNIIQQAKYITAMRPQDSVKRLELMDDMTVIDILREMEKMADQEGQQSTVSYLLSLMDPKRSSVIQRKMLAMQQ